MNGLDTSTAILLEKAGILEIAAETLHLVISVQVQNELAQNPRTRDLFGFLECLPPAELKTDSPFGPGELSLLLLYEQGVITAVFSDDGQFLKYCRNKNIPHYSALMVPLLLFRKKVLSRNKALRLFTAIQESGRYSAEIISAAQDYWN